MLRLKIRKSADYSYQPDPQYCIANDPATIPLAFGKVMDKLFSGLPGNPEKAQAQEIANGSLNN